VAVEAGRALGRETFTYSVPDGVDVVPGHRVTVPFGRRSSVRLRHLAGTEEPGVETKATASAWTGARCSLPHQVALARLVTDLDWVPVIECIRAMLPPRVRGTGSTGSQASSRQRRHTRLLELATGSAPPAARLTLTSEQEQALEVINANPVTLLHGVIASGKTEVYLAAAERASVKACRVLLLVPEISLSPQLVQRVRARLDVPIAVLHTQLTEPERAHQCRRPGQVGRGRIRVWAISRAGRCLGGTPRPPTSGMNGAPRSAGSPTGVDHGSKARRRIGDAERCHVFPSERGRDRARPDDEARARPRRGCRARRYA
jgi:primosomal protein N'